MVRKVPKRDYGQSKSEKPKWSPFAAPEGQQDITDDTEYIAFDRAKGRWITHNPKRIDRG